MKAMMKALACSALVLFGLAVFLTQNLRFAAAIPGLTIEHLGRACIRGAASGKPEYERILRDYVKKARIGLQNIRSQIARTSSPELKKRLQKQEARHKQVVNLCQSLLGPCEEEDSMLEVVIENKSVVLVEFLVMAGKRIPQAVGAVYPGTTAKASLPYMLLAEVGDPNVVVFHPSFNGDPIQDPSIRKQVKRTFLTVYPMRRPCVAKVTMRLTNRDFAPKTGIIVPPESGLTTDTWAGKWKCDSLTTPWDADLTISGQGTASTIAADFPTWIYAPAHEEYKIQAISKTSAEGTMILYDRHPPYLWSGSFSLAVQEEGLLLTRHDDATAWTGSYSCTRSSG